MDFEKLKWFSTDEEMVVEITVMDGVPWLIPVTSVRRDAGGVIVISTRWLVEGMETEAWMEIARKLTKTMETEGE